MVINFTHTLMNTVCQNLLHLRVVVLYAENFLSKCDVYTIIDEYILYILR